MPAATEDMTFKADFTEKTYKITYTQPDNGTITVTDATGTTITSGLFKSEYTITVKPDQDYQLSSLTATYGEGNTVELTPVEENAGQYTFTMPAGAVTITAAFEEVTYNVLLTQPTGGTISTDKEKAAEGATVTLTATPEAGYVFKAWQITPEVTIDGNNSFIMPASDVTVTATFEKEEDPEPPVDPVSYYNINVEDVCEDVKVYTKDGSLYVQTPQREQVIIVSMSGVVVKNEEQIGLKQYHGLKQGIYIVRVGNKTYKIRLN